jgi:hypothetical protein
VLVTDCKSLYDAVTGSESRALGLSDKRAAIECMAFKEGLDAMNAVLRWVHSHAQVADGCTKIKFEAQKLLAYFMARGSWTLIHDPNFESARKRGAKGLDIFEYTKESEENSDKFPDPSAKHDQKEFQVFQTRQTDPDANIYFEKVSVSERPASGNNSDLMKFSLGKDPEPVESLTVQEFSPCVVSEANERANSGLLDMSAVD